MNNPPPKAQTLPSSGGIPNPDLPGSTACTQLWGTLKICIDNQSPKHLSGAFGKCSYQLELLRYGQRC